MHAAGLAQTPWVPAMSLLVLPAPTHFCFSKLNTCHSSRRTALGLLELTCLSTERTGSARKFFPPGSSLPLTMGAPRLPIPLWIWLKLLPCDFAENQTLPCLRNMTQDNTNSATARKPHIHELLIMYQAQL